MHTRANYYEDEQRRDQGEMLRLQHVVPTLCCAVPFRSCQSECRKARCIHAVLWRRDFSRHRRSGRKITARGRKQDRARVAGGQDYEMRYELKKTGRSAPAVKKAVNARKRVEKRLGR